MPISEASDAVFGQVMQQLSELRAVNRDQQATIHRLEDELARLRAEHAAYRQELFQHYRKEMKPFTEEEIAELDSSGADLDDLVAELNLELGKQP